MESIIVREEVARLLHIRPTTVDYLRRKKGLPCVWVGKHCRYKLVEIERWLQEREGL